MGWKSVRRELKIHRWAFAFLWLLILGLGVCDIGYLRKITDEHEARLNNLYNNFMGHKHIYHDGSVRFDFGCVKELDGIVCPDDLPADWLEYQKEILKRRSN